MSVYLQFYLEVQEVLRQGGIVLWLMLVLSVILYGTIASTWLGLWELRKNAADVSGHLEECSSENDVARAVEIFELEELAWVERRFPVIAVMIALAPLAGLLGTVSGMLATFAGLASQATAKPIDGISSGISEALVTTQTGLFMAIPAAFLFVILKILVSHLRGEIEHQASSQIIVFKKSQA